MLISICIPMYNESDCVEKCIFELLSCLDKLKCQNGFEFEIIFSDDGSTDNSHNIVSELSADRSEIKTVGESVNKGKGSAVRLAVKHACGDIIIFTDCDLAYGTSVISKAIERIIYDDFDVVVGSRNLTNDGYGDYGKLRKIASKVYVKFLSFLGGLELSDSQCGFKAFKGKAAEKIFSKVMCDGFAFDYEVILVAEKLGMSIGEMPVKVVTHKSSKVHLVRDSIRMLFEFIKIKQRVAHAKF